MKYIQSKKCTRTRFRPAFPYKSSHRGCSVKKGVLKNFEIFTGKHRGLKTCNFFKKRPPTQVFSCEYCEIFKNTYFEKHLRTTASICRRYVNTCFCRNTPVLESLFNNVTTASLLKSDSSTSVFL